MLFMRTLWAMNGAAEDVQTAVPHLNVSHFTPADVCTDRIKTEHGVTRVRFSADGAALLTRLPDNLLAAEWRDIRKKLGRSPRDEQIRKLLNLNQTKVNHIGIGRHPYQQTYNQYDGSMCEAVAGRDPDGHPVSYWRGEPQRVNTLSACYMLYARSCREGKPCRLVLESVSLDVLLVLSAMAGSECLNSLAFDKFVLIDPFAAWKPFLVSRRLKTLGVNGSVSFASRVAGIGHQTVDHSIYGLIDKISDIPEKDFKLKELWINFSQGKGGLTYIAEHASSLFSRLTTFFYANEDEYSQTIPEGTFTALSNALEQIRPGRHFHLLLDVLDPLIPEVNRAREHFEKLTMTSAKRLATAGPGHDDISLAIADLLSYAHRDFLRDLTGDVPMGPPWHGILGDLLAGVSWFHNKNGLVYYFMFRLLRLVWAHASEHPSSASDMDGISRLLGMYAMQMVEPQGSEIPPMKMDHTNPFHEEANFVSAFEDRTLASWCMMVGNRDLKELLARDSTRGTVLETIKNAMKVKGFTISSGHSTWETLVGT
jgi:hypothetical protein